MPTAAPPPSATGPERATSAAPHSFPYLSQPHPAARRFSLMASRDPAPAPAPLTPRARARPTLPCALAPTLVGCEHAPPPPRTQVARPPHRPCSSHHPPFGCADRHPPPHPPRARTSHRTPADWPACGPLARDRGLKAADWASVIRSSSLIDRCSRFTLFLGSSSQLALVEVSFISNWCNSVAPNPDSLS
uniref:Uncharacterized protein n=1 Tax=Molossus molossus TaxID=27622 RepID=A0A7J8GKA8_MOLMO|nr:hypothetical protein HJG59_011457 [Molossus molossus]